jgi:hypothetical protein
MTRGRAELGHTRLENDDVFVSPLPMLRTDRHGREIVEGLILHEIGHHLYHRGDAASRVWRRAQRRGLFGLLNLVADEHLERNLRALDPAFGDRLKRLVSHAFQHASSTHAVRPLLDRLLGRGAQVLTATTLGPAYPADSIVVHRGQLARDLDRLGDSFARFVRALRLGLGDRVGDDKVRRALALFDDGFRHLGIPGLFRVTTELAKIFGDSEFLAECAGTLDSLEWSERDTDVHGRGIDDDAIQREIRRITEALPPSHGETARGGDAAIHVGDDTAFAPITEIRRIAPDPARHRLVAQTVRRHAERLRTFLVRLVVAMTPRRARLRGRAFDRAKALAVVTRGEPRMLIAREFVRDTDLFLGVVIDCSSSMAGADLEKAARFGVLIAEAVAGLRNVDARFFGFTDRVLFDAGDARQCAVASLTSNGGNNDAAALCHVAGVAMASRRRAKLLVMISDGLPTECSVAALRKLVEALTHRGLCCAQVAVQPLEEICFPHYIVLDEAMLDVSVRRFGELVARLVRTALGR